MARARSDAGKHGTKYGSESFDVPGGGCSFASLPPGLLVDVADAVTSEGDCLMLSRTRDGGAIHVRILADGLVEKWYAGKNEELQALMEQIMGALTARTTI